MGNVGAKPSREQLFESYGARLRRDALPDDWIRAGFFGLISFIAGSGIHKLSGAGWPEVWEEVRIFLLYGVAGVGTAAILWFLWTAIRVPFRQRDDARKALAALEDDDVAKTIKALQAASIHTGTEHASSCAVLVSCFKSLPWRFSTSALRVGIIGPYPPDDEDGEIYEAYHEFGRVKTAEALTLFGTRGLLHDRTAEEFNRQVASSGGRAPLFPIRTSWYEFTDLARQIVDRLEATDQSLGKPLDGEGSSA